MLKRVGLGVEVVGREDGHLVHSRHHGLVVEIVAPLTFELISVDEAETIEDGVLGIAAGVVKNQAVAINGEGDGTLGIAGVFVDGTAYLHAGQPHAVGLSVGILIEPIDHLTEGHGNGAAFNGAFNPGVGGGVRDDVLDVGFLTVLAEHHF